ncbi:microtubule associated protein-domain-containing protein [Cantharellus anzutake]|uniref:microtubule associated protein-domain-containing protein n=1 Tax=Cantharellus anzutake TaxID=1750568 RepID=UPI0019042068|nr:microtubule associated protein-domain-containing protein [Cantharellus anzutake]XP_038923504.1 microtubule associated protein-domain-containing protein [Cantharellus anzutake]KAF8326231.1 microtubule associated protein-domain-containing protein [Cantharellus anzutake]KAF8343059.1 microtubule associated protein-domain-containing protein [Cantharellus anzutake]
MTTDTSGKAKELLDSLVEPLTAQVHLLPAIHAQLGLPSSAIAADLDKLRVVLADAIEAQIQQRRSEVKAWLERCDKVEKDCNVLAKSTGLDKSEKPPTSTISELRKITNIPERLEQLVALRDSLNAIYAVKFEEKNALTVELERISKIVGLEFYSADVLSAINISASDAKGNDALWRDVTPQKLNKLEREIKRGLEEISTRQAELTKLLEQIMWLHSELGLEIPDPDAVEDLSIIIADEQQAATSFNHSATQGHASSSTRATPQMYNRVLSEFAARIAELDEDSFENFVFDGVDPTLDIISYFGTILQELEQRMKTRQQQIQSMYDELEVVWKRLNIPEIETEGFVERNRGTTDDVIQAYEAELARMTELKLQSLSGFIAIVRGELQSLWVDLMMGPNDRALFAPMWKDEEEEEDPEALLNEHDLEVARLKEEKRSKAHILPFVKKYFEISNDEKILAESASDTSRLTGRGNRDPGRLLREEKMRKRVRKEKPRLLRELLDFVSHWEAEHRSEFRVEDTSLLACLQQDAEAETSSNQSSQKRTKAATMSIRSVTPAPGGSVQGSAQKHGLPSSDSGPLAKRARLTPTNAPRKPNSTTHSRGVTPTPSNNRNTTPATFGTTVRAPLRVSSQSNGTVPPLPPSYDSVKISAHPSISNTSSGHGFGSVIGLGTAPLRLPNGASGYAQSLRSGSGSTVRSVSASSIPRPPSAALAQATAKVARRRDSFKPRPSLDYALVDLSGMHSAGCGGEEILEESDEELEVY